MPQRPTTPITGEAVAIPRVVTPEPEALLTTLTPSRSTVSFTLRDAEQAVRHVWKTKMTAEQQALWVERERVDSMSSSYVRYRVRRLASNIPAKCDIGLNSVVGSSIYEIF